MLIRRWAILALAAAAIAGLCIWRYPAKPPLPPAPTLLDEVELRAGLGRAVRGADFSGITFGQALERLGSVSGTRIVVDDKLRSSTVPRGTWTARKGGRGLDGVVSLSFGDAQLAIVLDMLIGQTVAEFPGGRVGYSAMEDGTILVAYEDDLPRFVRTYDVSDLLKSPRTQARRLVDLVALSQGRAIAASSDRLIWPGGGRLVVVDTRRGHDGVARMLRWLRKLGTRWADTHS